MASFRQLRRLLTGQFRGSWIAIDKGRAAFKAGDYTRSESAFLEALGAGQEEATCRRYLARIYNRTGNWSKALEQWLWLRDQDSRQVEAQLQVARAYFRLENYESAAVGFRSVLSLSADHVEAQEKLSQIGALTGAVAADRDEGDRETSAASLLEEARRAFKAEDDALGEAC